MVGAQRAHHRLTDVDAHRDELRFVPGIHIGHGDLQRFGVAVGIPARRDVEPRVERGNDDQPHRHDHGDHVARCVAQVAFEDAPEVFHRASPLVSSSWLSAWRSSACFRSACRTRSTSVPGSACSGPAWRSSMRRLSICLPAACIGRYDMPLWNSRFSCSIALRNSSALISCSPSVDAYRSRMYSTTIRYVSIAMIDTIHAVSMPIFCGITNSSTRKTNGSTPNAMKPMRTSRGYRLKNRRARSCAICG